MRQLDVWEAYGLLILLTEKGRICAFKLNDLSQNLNESNFQTRNKNQCRENRVELINSCSIYAIKKQPLNYNECFKIVASCGKKLIIIESNSTSNSQNSICDTCKTSANPLHEFSSLNLNSPSSYFDSNSSPNLIINNDKFNEINDLFYFKKVI